MHFFPDEVGLYAASVTYYIQCYLDEKKNNRNNNGKDYNILDVFFIYYIYKLT